MSPRPPGEFRPGPAEEQALEAFAEELRRATADPSLPEAFVQELAEAQAAGWSLRRALRRDPLMRLAAAALLVAGASAPLLAVMQLAGLLRPGTPVIRVEMPAPLPRSGREEWLPLPVAPEEPVPLELLSEDWLAALARENRFAQAAFAWHARFPMPGVSAREPQVTALLEAAGGARSGVALRLGLSAPEEPPSDWSRAGAAALWSELQRRLAAGSLPPASGPAARRVRQLWREAGAAEERGWLKDWMAILDGPEAVVGVPGPPRPPGTAALWWDRLLGGAGF